MAEGYRLVGPDTYTRVAPAGLEADPAVTAAIREFDPGLVPIWRIQLWTFPGSETLVSVVHHGIARFFPVPRYMKRQFHVEMPVQDHTPPPNVLDTILEDTSIEECQKRGGPGGFIPWDWALYRWCRWCYDRITAENYLRLLKEAEERKEREYKAILEEIEGRRKELEPYLLRKAESVSEHGWKQYERFMKEREAERRAGVPPKHRQPLKERTPFIVVRSPRNDATHGRVAPAKELGEANAGNP